MTTVFFTAYVGAYSRSINPVLLEELTAERKGVPKANSTLKVP